MTHRTPPDWLRDADGALIAAAALLKIDAPADDGLCTAYLLDGSRVFLPAGEVARLHRAEPIATVAGRNLYGR